MIKEAIVSSFDFFRDQKKSRANVAVLKSRTSNVTQQHYNIKNIYAPDPVKGLKNKVY